MTNFTTQEQMPPCNGGAPVAIPPAHPPCRVPNNGPAQTIYLLYCLGYFTGISALIGVIIAHVKVQDTDPVLRSHYQFQIRTFWIGLLNLAIGIPLSMFLIGLPILAWGLLWSLICIIKGIVLVNEYKPIANPKSWMFG